MNSCQELLWILVHWTVIAITMEEPDQSSQRVAPGRYFLTAKARSEKSNCRWTCLEIARKFVCTVRQEIERVIEQVVCRLGFSDVRKNKPQHSRHVYLSHMTGADVFFANHCTNRMIEGSSDECVQPPIIRKLLHEPQQPRGVHDDLEPRCDFPVMGDGTKGLKPDKTRSTDV